MFKIRKFKLFIPQFLLFLPYLLLNSCISTTAPILMKIINFIIFLITPGYYLAIMIGKEIKLNLDEILVLNIIISMSISCLMCIYLTFFFNKIKILTISLGLFLVVFPMSLIHYFKSDNNYYPKEVSSNFTCFLSLFISFLIGFIFTKSVIPEIYWRGWDPWINTPISKYILENGSTPLQLKGYPPISGFWYFLASLKIFTGISYYSITRFGGPFLSGLSCMIVFLIIKRLEGWFQGIFSSIVLVLNPWFVYRFSMTLRENFAYNFFLCSIFISITYKNKKHTRNIYFPLVLSLLLSIILASNFLTTVIIFGLFLQELIFFRHKLDKRYFTEVINSMILSMLLSLPFIRDLLVASSWYLDNWMDYSKFLILVIFLALMIYLNKYIITENNMKLRWILDSIFFLGALYAILFLSKSYLNPWCPPSFFDMFSKMGLILAFFSILTIKLYSIPSMFISLSSLIIFILNITILGIYFSYERTAIYISFLISYGSARTLTFFNNFLEKLNIYFKYNRNNSFKLNNKFIAFLIISLILFFELQSFINITKNWGVTNIKKEEVEDAYLFIKNIDPDDIVIPWKGTSVLLRYVGLHPDRLILNMTLLNELYSIKEPCQFLDILKLISNNGSYIYIVTLKRKGYIPSNSQLELISIFGNKHNIGSIEYYKIQNLEYELKKAYNFNGCWP